eukprot:Sspe_Gene.57208::Locus_31403_Transcript_1_2_Confidence_0.667_Length_697::g.57208::m.57208
MYCPDAGSEEKAVKDRCKELEEQWKSKSEENKRAVEKHPSPLKGKATVPCVRCGSEKKYVHSTIKEGCTIHGDEFGTVIDYCPTCGLFVRLYWGSGSPSLKKLSLPFPPPPPPPPP